MKTNDSFNSKNRNFAPCIAFSGEEPSFFTASSVFSGYGARYLESRTGRWLSADPAMGEYIPSPGQDSSKLPGLGGIYNTVNFHVYHYAGNNPVKYTDPDGDVIRKVTDNIHQQNSKEQLGTGSTTIDKEGCVLTTFVRIANAISTNKFTLEEGNDIANKLNLYTNKDELSHAAGAELISSLTGFKISSGMFEGTEDELMKKIKNMAENPYEGFFVTGRIEAKSSDGKSTYGHQVNINEKSNGNKQPIVDTSTRGRTSTGGDSNGKEPIYRVYWFKVERE